jgi:transglutaminase-like putative cysteine protease
MQRLRIHHLTRYQYTRAVTLSRHRLVIRPREGHDLRVEQFMLRIEPAHHITWVRDVFGNSIAWVDFSTAAESLTIEVEAVVQRFVPFPARGLHDPVRVGFPVQYDALELPVIAGYLATSYVDEAAAVSSWLNSSLQVDTADAEGTALALCELIHRTIRYRRREEKGVQSPVQTLQLASGSCRDVATLMMEAARALQLGARFASGYLHGSASLAGTASTHAWCEIYLPALGWRGFDATLGTAISLRHVVTGVSNHPRGVMPVSGSFIGSRADFSGLTAQVSTEELPVRDP